MPWPQNYDPLQNSFLSTLAAVLPIVVLLGCLGLLRLKAHLSALLGLGVALLVATLIFGMPPVLAGASALYGAAYGLLPVGWIILNVIFLYRLTNEKGLFKVLQGSLTSVTRDRRLQLLLVAFCFGAFFEGAAGFGTPVAVTAAILIGLGFQPLVASGLSLIANTAPVAFGGLGTPLVALATVTGLDLNTLAALTGRTLAFFDLLVPFWLIAAFAGLGGMLEIWPALLVAGGSFAIVQLLVSNLHGPWLVNILAALVSLACLVLFLLRWRPKRIWGLPGDSEAQADADQPIYSRREVIRAWTPWIILSLLIFLWGLPGVKSWLDSFSVVLIPIPALHEMVLRVPPIVAAAHAESAVFTFNGLSTTGTAILLAALVSGLWMGYSLPELVRAYGAALRQIRFSALTIAAMMAIGFVTRYAGLDATMGLAFARTGVLYPFFGTLLGWLGVALTGSDTSSNVLFGSLQRVTAEQLGLNPYLMASANSAGGVMGKMIDAQSIVVASTATRWFGHEGDILRYVFFHSLALAVLVALLILLQAYVPPFTWMAAVP